MFPSLDLCSAQVRISRLKGIETQPMHHFGSPESSESISRLKGMETFQHFSLNAKLLRSNLQFGKYFPFEGNGNKVVV